MKKILALILTVITVLSTGLIGVNAEYVASGKMGVDFIIPDTVVPGEYLYSTFKCWIIPSESASEDMCSFASDFTFKASDTSVVFTDIFDVTSMTIEAVSDNIPVTDVIIDWDDEYEEVMPQFGSDIAVTGGEKTEFVFKVGVKVKESVSVGTEIVLKAAYGKFVASLSGDMNKIDCEVNPIESNKCTVVAPAATHKSATALGGQVKTTNPAGLRLGFSIADLGETPASVKILVKKADGEWKTVNVVNYYNTEKTIFTVCITNIPENAKDVEFSAKAVVTFADGNSTESSVITRSYNSVTTAIDSGWQNA